MHVPNEQESIARTAAATRPAAAVEEPELPAHPGPRRYVIVAIYLAVATALEVGLYYLKLPHPLLVTLLLVLAVLKFTLVALWFMHLRFDSPIFRRLFVTGLSLAVAVYVIVLVIFGALKAPFLLLVVLVLVVAPAAVLLLRRRTVTVAPPSGPSVSAGEAHG